jgi:hypothetical protein
MGERGHVMEYGSFFRLAVVFICLLVKEFYISRIPPLFTPSVLESAFSAGPSK